ncbi:MAG: SLC13 family permease [Clostridiaceae bacterium]|nr:anion permease [Eubacteriales bacterium]
MGKRARPYLHLALGLILFTLIALLPEALFSREARFALATLALMVYWWIARPVHIAVTAFLPIVVNAVFKFAPMDGVLADYFSQIAVLLIGAHILIACFIGSGLDRRLALRVLTLIGPSVKRQLAVWFALAALMSAFLPNAVVAATLCPIAASMVRFSLSDREEPTSTKASFLIQLAIVWGTSLGGFATPLGGAMNLITINYIESYTGTEFMYAAWTLKMLPYILVLCLGICGYMLSIKPDVAALSGSRAYFKGEYRKLGKMKRAELLALVLFTLSVLLAFTRPLYEKLMPELKPYYVFLVAGVAAFFLPGEGKKPLVTWELASKHMNWGLILLFSGGLAAGNLIIVTGAADAVARTLAALNIQSVYLLMLLFAALGMFLANTSSNTAAVAVVIPVVIGITSGMKLDPLPYVFLTSVACNCAYALPTSIRAIPVGYGLDIKYMLKKGMVAIGLTMLMLAVLALVAI